MPYGSWSDTALKYGDPVQKEKAQRIRAGAIQHLIGLETEEGSRENRARQGGPFSSGYNGEGDYIKGLNRQGQIADLRSRIAGQGPAKVQHSYGGTDFAMSPNTRLQQRGTPDPSDETDNLDFYGRQAGVQSAQADAERRRVAAFEEGTANDPAMNAIRRRERSADLVEHGRASGVADAAEYMAPGQHDARRQKLWDDEERRRRLSPYDPAYIRGDATLGAAEIAANSRVVEAGVRGGAQQGSAAIGALGRLAGAPALDPAQEGRIGAATEAIRPNVPGQRDVTPGSAGLKPFPAARLAEYAQANHYGSEEEAIEGLRRHGYEVR